MLSHAYYGQGIVLGTRYRVVNSGEGKVKKKERHEQKKKTVKRFVSNKC